MLLIGKTLVNVQVGKRALKHAVAVPGYEEKASDGSGDGADSLAPSRLSFFLLFLTLPDFLGTFCLSCVSTCEAVSIIILSSNLHRAKKLKTPEDKHKKSGATGFAVITPWGIKVEAGC